MYFRKIQTSSGSQKLKFVKSPVATFFFVLLWVYSAPSPLSITVYPHSLWCTEWFFGWMNFSVFDWNLFSNSTTFRFDLERCASCAKNRGILPKMTNFNLTWTILELVGCNFGWWVFCFFFIWPKEAFDFGVLKTPNFSATKTSLGEISSENIFAATAKWYHQKAQPRDR